MLVKFHTTMYGMRNVLLPNIFFIFCSILASREMTLPKKLRESIKEFQDDPAFIRWMTRLESKAQNTVELYLYKFFPFLYRFNYTPTTLYEARLREIQSSDPLQWGIIRDQALRFMREMTQGDTNEWSEQVKQYFRLDPRGTPYRLSPSASRALAKALVSFFETFGERMELRLKAKDMPQGDSDGSQLIPVEQVALCLKQPGEKNPYRNVAIMMFLKDSGLRRGELQLFTIQDYQNAKKNSYLNEMGETFLEFEPIRTTKEGLTAHVIIGPEAVQAIDDYLQYERPDASPKEPLFHHSWRNVASGLNGPAVGRVVKRMIQKALGPQGRNKSSHSLRKLHKTALEAGGMPEAWINYLQGKTRGEYSRPEELDPETPSLINAYMEAYDHLRVHRESMELREQFKRIQEEKKADQEVLQYLKLRVTLLEQAIPNILKNEETMKKLTEQNKNP